MVLRRVVMAALSMAAAMLRLPVVEAQTPAAGWEEHETPRFFLLQNGSVIAGTAATTAGASSCGRRSSM